MDIDPIKRLTDAFLDLASGTGSMVPFLNRLVKELIWRKGIGTNGMAQKRVNDSSYVDDRSDI